MTESREYFVIADGILMEDGLVGYKALHVINGMIAGFPDNHLIADNADVHDYPGHIITPCFCDYHMHFFGRLLEDTHAVAEALRASGITKVFEGGDRNLSGLRVKAQLKNSLEIETAGYAIYKKGSYGQYIGKGVESISGARELIDKLKRDGVDYIKVINSGIFLPETGEISGGGFDANELKHIVRHATELGFKVACHANGEHAVRDAVEAGASFIIHGLNVSDDTLSAMHEQGTSLVPTVHAFARLRTVNSKQKAVRNIDKAVESQLSTVNSAHGKKVRILPGSDAGPEFIPCGVSFLEELKLFHRAGLDRDTIYKSAITEPFKKGMRADYLLVEGFEIKEVHIT